MTIPEIVMSVTAHPCYDKAAEYMGLKVKRVKVNTETYQADVDEKNIWLHLDACVGGLVLPFMKELGEKRIGI
ncbi:MAG: hypothetical protein QXF28_07550 [Nitrososphaerota archaeon]